MSDLISKRELYHKLGEAYNKGFFSWGVNEVIKDIIGECDSVENKGDLISRQAVLNKLNRLIEVEKLQGTDEMGYGRERVSAYESMIYEVESEYLYPPVENRGEWIPVSERLPDNNVRVLCSAISTSISGGYTRFVGCCDNGDWFVQTDAETVSYPRQYKVTAWMPLPEPYKAEKGGE